MGGGEYNGEVRRVVAGGFPVARSSLVLCRKSDILHCDAEIDERRETGIYMLGRVSEAMGGGRAVAGGCITAWATAALT